MTRTNGDPGSEGGPGDGGEGEKGTSSGIPGSRRFVKMADSAGSTAGSAYQGAMESVFAIVIATGIGYWADTKFGTAPRWLIVGAIVGFAAFVLRLARMAKLVEGPASQIEDAPETGEALDPSNEADRPD